MVRIADPIWAAWREQMEQGHEHALLVLLSPAGDTGAAVTALRESVLEIQDAYEAETQSSGDAERASPGRPSRTCTQPDAFGVQLLGPGYAGRLPESANWREERVGSASVLLEHVDLTEWFDAPFVPPGQLLAPADQPEPPAVLAQARVELPPILHSPGVLAGAGYPDIQN